MFVKGNGVFDTDAPAIVGIVEARFDRNHVAGLQYCGVVRQVTQTGTFVDIEPNAMAKAVIVSHFGLGIAPSGGIAQRLEIIKLIPLL